MAVMKTENAIDFYDERIRWKETGDVDYPYRASFEDHDLLLRLNDFPAEPLYTIIVDGEEITDIEEWSPRWKREQKEVCEIIGQA